MKTLASLRPARTGLGGQRWLVYGPPKIGKSTFASLAPGNPLFLDCEYGLGFLDAYVISCMTWTQISEAIDKIALGGHDHKTIVIDTVDRFVALATEHAQIVLGVEHVADAGYGKGYARVRELIDAALFKLAAGGRLVLLISHDRTEHKEGQPERTRPSVPRTDQILAFCDVIAHVEIAEDGERLIRFRGTTTVIAGSRGRGGQSMFPPALPLSWETIQKHVVKAAARATDKQAANPSDKPEPETKEEAQQ